MELRGACRAACLQGDVATASFDTTATGRRRWNWFDQRCNGEHAWTPDLARFVQRASRACGANRAPWLRFVANRQVQWRYTCKWCGAHTQLCLPLRAGPRALTEAFQRTGVAPLGHFIGRHSINNTVIQVYPEGSWYCPCWNLRTECLHRHLDNKQKGAVGSLTGGGGAGRCGGRGKPCYSIPSSRLIIHCLFYEQA